MKQHNNPPPPLTTDTTSVQLSRAASEIVKAGFSVPVRWIYTF